jgi:hypothetical protein
MVAQISLCCNLLCHWLDFHVWKLLSMRRYSSDFLSGGLVSVAAIRHYILVSLFLKALGFLSVLDGLRAHVGKIIRFSPTAYLASLSYQETCGIMTY